MKVEPNGGRIGEIAVKQMMQERRNPEEIVITKIKVGRRLFGHHHCGKAMRKVTVFYYRSSNRTCPIHIPKLFSFKIFVCACSQCNYVYVPEYY